ncbi:MAG: GPR1/FUN34/YaaH family transporter [Acidimicrobiales bacterium]
MEVNQAGDPLVLGLAVFVVGAVALGMQLLDFVTAGGSVVPIALAASGLGLLVSTFWAIRLEQTFVAGVVGIFAAFWLSYAVLLLGLSHNWFGIPPEDVLGTIRLFLIAWAVLGSLLLIASLRLPAAFPLLIALVVATVIVLIIAYAGDTPSSGLRKVGGVVLLGSAAVGAYLFISSAFVSLGGKALPTGKPILK